MHLPVTRLPSLAPRRPATVVRVDLSVPYVLQVGGLTRAELVAALVEAGVQLNRSAEVLLDGPGFERTNVETVSVVVRSVEDLGLAHGAVLAEIYAAARAHGLVPCPVTAGPYLRLRWTDQVTAPDSVVSNGRAPRGSLTVASESLRNDDDYPKGFYLRVIDDMPWLRGYRCSARHRWSPADRLAFAVA